MLYQRTSHLPLYDFFKRFWEKLPQLNYANPLEIFAAMHSGLEHVVAS